MTGNTTDITTASANTARVGAMVRRSTPNNRVSAGTQPSGSNSGAEVAEELSVSGSGILPIPPTRRGKRVSGVGSRVTTPGRPAMNFGRAAGHDGDDIMKLLGGSMRA